VDQLQTETLKYLQQLIKQLEAGAVVNFPCPPFIPTDAQSIDTIAAAEAKISSSMACFLEEFLRKVACIPNFEKQAELVRSVLCAFSCKEKAIAEVINALANKIRADKNILPGNNCC
jgi:hypothetical protein